MQRACGILLLEAEGAARRASLFSKKDGIISAARPGYIKENRAKAAMQAAAMFFGLLGGVLPQGSCLLGAAEFSATKRR